MNLAFVSFVIACVCFALLWLETSIGHLLDAGLFFTALGLALSSVPNWPNRGP